MNKKYFPKLLILNLFTSAHCTLTQMALTMTLSYIFSNTIFMFSFFTGLYLMAMGLGAYFVEKFEFESPKLINIILLNSLVGIILANPGIVGLIIGNEYLYLLLRQRGLDLTFLMFPFGILFTLCIGIVSGAELPIFSKLIEKEKWHVSKPIVGVLTSDYFGAFIGIIVFTFLLNPFVGLISAVIFSQILTLIVINFCFFSIPLFEKSRFQLSLVFLINIYVIILFLLRFSLAGFIDGISSI